MRTSSVSRCLFPVIALVLSAASTLPSALAQSVHSQQAVAVVPFSFSNGAYSLAAGKYLLQKDATSNFVMVRGEHDNLYTFMRSETTLTPPAAGKLVFKRYNNQYFLREIWFAGSSSYLICPESSKEKLQRVAASKVPASTQEVAVLETTR